MKMCYRGVSYEYNPTPVKIDREVAEFKFRGGSYTKSHVLMDMKSNSKENIVYRGISFAMGNKVRFLGQSSEVAEIKLFPVSSIA